MSHSRLLTGFNGIPHHFLPSSYLIPFPIFSPFTPLSVLTPRQLLLPFINCFKFPRISNLNLHSYFGSSMDRPPPPSSSSGASFPILAISIVGILTTAILLLSYYIFVIKCCLNWNRLLSLSRRRDDHLAAYPIAVEGRGLRESAIRAIPTFRFRRGEGKGSFHECAVCLNEFQEQERIRLLPNCFHVFHIDCIDTWLQTNANCPLCRSDITTTSSIPAARFMAQTIHQNLHHSGDIVIEIRDEAGDRSEGSQCDRKKGRKLHHVCSMGDECIDIRMKDERFSVQPMRRSFSMDSSGDKQLCLAVQEILKQNPHFKEVGGGEGSSSGGSWARARRPFFSFGRCRSSRSSVLPIETEL